VNERTNYHIANVCVCNVYVHVHLLSGIRATQTTSVKQLHAGSAYLFGVPCYKLWSCVLLHMGK